MAPSGGFSTSFFFFDFLPLSSFDSFIALYVSSCWEVELSEGLIEESKIDDDGVGFMFEDEGVFIEEVTLIEDDCCCWDDELFSDDVFDFDDLSLLGFIEVSWAPYVAFLLKLAVAAWSRGFTG